MREEVNSNNPQSSSYSYQVGGSLPLFAPSYVKRRADEELFNYLKSGEFCYVLNSRQMGKSSLRVQTMQRLQAEGIACSVIDITSIGTQQITPEQWYASLIGSLVSSFRLSVNLRTWWREREHFSCIKRLSDFFETVLLTEVSQNIVIFIDEIDSVLGLKFPIDDFFAWIRACYNKRTEDPAYRRLTFALLGVATPADLIADKNRTPFNIGKAIQLNGFALQEAQPLVQGFVGKVSHPQQVLAEVLTWTGGQPFLTQKLCLLVVQEEATSIEQLVRKRIIENWESQDEPEHLKTIRDRLLKNEKRAGRLLGLYQQILQQGEIAVDDSPEQMELRLSGLVVKREGYLKAANPIYQEIFNLNWLKQELGKLRPYAEMFQAWLASHCQDESRLLRGQALKDALAWAETKSLSNEDYQFLNASQQVEQREDKKALEAERQARLLEKLDTDIALEAERKAREAVEQAHQLLAKAQRKAKQEPLNRRIWLKWRIFVSLSVATIVVFLRLTGLLQPLELAAFDQMMRLRPSQGVEDRILIVSIDEQDLQKVDQWPIPDRLMADLLQKLHSLQPRAIGLYIYRDLPVEPGYAELEKTLKNIPNLIAIEYIGNQRSQKIPPPPALKQTNQFGFSDIMVDNDGKVRRSILYFKFNNQIHESFAFRLALMYLKVQGIQTETVKGTNYFQLGKAAFVAFEANDGGYVRADPVGHQILANFQKPSVTFPTVSLTDVLANKVPAELVRNRIVLIGSTAVSLKDFYFTPYSRDFNESAKKIPGVELQANFISQILTAAETGRGLIKVWSDPLEYLWIYICAWLGAILIWRSPSATKSIFILLLAGASLTISAYLLFLADWWIPLVPPMLVLIGFTIVMLIITNHQLEKLRLRRTLELILEVYEDNPAASYIAIEYLKRSESKGNRALINQWLHKIKPFIDVNT